MRILAIILLWFAAFTASHPASARDGAWYVGGDFGALILPDVDIIIKNPAGVLVARTQTNSTGRFMVELAPGKYAVEIPSATLRKALDKVSPNGPLKYLLRLHLALVANSREVANLSAMFNRNGPVTPLSYKVTIPAIR